MKFVKVTFVLLLISCASFSQSVYSTDGDSTFNYSTIHTVNIYFSDPSFWDSLTLYHTTGQCLMGTVNIDGTTLDSVCVELKGNSSYNSMPGVKKSIKLSFDEYKNQKYDGLKTLNLNNSFKDPTFMREKLMCDFLNQHGVPSPRCTYSHVYINGIYWGFYTMAEQVNKTFLTYRFGNNDGNLFKGDPHGDLKWLGNLPTPYYSNYELKTNDSANNWTDLIYLIDKINNTSPSQFFDTLPHYLNIDYAIKAWAANMIFVNLDSYNGSGHNFYIYHDTISNLFNWIAWDMNEAFGNFNMGMTINQIENLPVSYIPVPFTNRPLINNMWKDNNFKQQYLTTIYNWIGTDFSDVVLYPKIDSIANAIRNFVYADPNKQFTNANFDFNIDNDMGQIPGLKDFIKARRDNLIQQLIQLGFPPAGLNENNFEEGIFVFPNPVTNTSQVVISNSNQNLKVEFYDFTGRLIQSQNVNSTFTIERKDFKPGNYFIKIKGDTKMYRPLRFVID